MNRRRTAIVAKTVTVVMAPMMAPERSSWRCANWYWICSGVAAMVDGDWKYLHDYTLEVESQRRRRRSGTNKRAGPSLRGRKWGEWVHVGHSFGLNEFVLSLHSVEGHGKQCAAIFFVAKAFPTVVAIGEVGGVSTSGRQFSAYQVKAGRAPAPSRPCSASARVEAAQFSSSNRITYTLGPPPSMEFRKPVVHWKRLACAFVLFICYISQASSSYGVQEDLTCICAWYRACLPCLIMDDVLVQ